MLYRINARSEPFEEAFAAAAIPYQVRDGAFLRRPGPRSVLQRLKRAGGARWPRPSTAITDAARLRPRGRARRRRGGHAPGRPRPDARRWRRSSSARTPTATSRRSSPSSPTRFSTEQQRPRREPAHVPPREGARVRRGVPAAAARRRAPVPLGPREGRPRGGAPAPLRRDHARPPVPVPHVADATAARSRARSWTRWSSRRRCRRRGDGGARSGGHGRPGRRAVRPAEGVAPQARAGGRRARVRRVPRPDARRDRRAAAARTGPTSRRSRASGPAKLERYADEVLAVVSAG